MRLPVKYGRHTSLEASCYLLRRVITAQGEATREPSAYIEGDGALITTWEGMELGYKGLWIFA